MTKHLVALYKKWIFKNVFLLKLYSEIYIKNIKFLSGAVKKDKIVVVIKNRLLKTSIAPIPKPKYIYHI